MNIKICNIKKRRNAQILYATLFFLIPLLIAINLYVGLGVGTLLVILLNNRVHNHKILAITLISLAVLIFTKLIVVLYVGAIVYFFLPKKQFSKNANFLLFEKLNREKILIDNNAHIAGNYMSLQDSINLLLTSVNNLEHLSPTKPYKTNDFGLHNINEVFVKITGFGTKSTLSITYTIMRWCSYLLTINEIQHIYTQVKKYSAKYSSEEHSIFVGYKVERTQDKKDRYIFALEGKHSVCKKLDIKDFSHYELIEQTQKIFDQIIPTQTPTVLDVQKKPEQDLYVIETTIAKPVMDTEHMAKTLVSHLKQHENYFLT